MSDRPTEVTLASGVFGRVDGTFGVWELRCRPASAERDVAGIRFIMRGRWRRLETARHHAAQRWIVKLERSTWTRILRLTERHEQQLEYLGPDAFMRDLDESPRFLLALAAIDDAR